MMGATLPLLARHAVREDRQLGRRIGALYAVNTTGAIAGTLLAAFALLPSIGLRATIVAAAGVNAMVFLAAWALAQQAPPPASAAPLPSELETAAGRARWILPLIAVSGFTSFAYEVLWVRLLGHMVGVGVIAFSVMLASFLAGIALGSAIAARLATTRRSAGLGFALAQLGVAALSLLAFAISDRMPDLREALHLRGVSRLSNVPLCMLTLLPPTLMIGATFPFAVRVLASGSEDAGPASARVYAANTLGSIAGAVGAGFFLIPALGFEGMLGMGVAINLLLAALAALLFEPRRRWLARGGCHRRDRVGAGAAGSALADAALHVAVGEAPGLGRARLLRCWPLVHRPGHRSTPRLRTAHQRPAGRGDRPPGVWHNRHPLTRWLTALPVLARPEVRTLVVIGLGGGTALEIVPPTIERIDVIELEPEVVAANRALAGLRWRDPLRDPRLHIHLNDARNALLLSEERFDVVVSRSPRTPGPAAPPTSTRRSSSSSSRAVLRTTVSSCSGSVSRTWTSRCSARCSPRWSAVFPHVQAYNPPPAGSSVLFIASKAPFAMEASVARALAAAPDSFALLGITRPEDVFASLLLDDAGARELAAGAPLNRDRHNRLQSRSMDLGAASLRITDSLFGPVDPLVRARPGGLDVFYLLRRLDPDRALRVARSLENRLDRAVGEALAGIAEAKRATPRRQLEEALAEQPRHVEARAALLRLSSNSVARGAHPEEILAPPLLEEERVLRGRGPPARAIPTEQRCASSIPGWRRFRSPTRSAKTPRGCASSRGSRAAIPSRFARRCGSPTPRWATGPIRALCCCAPRPTPRPESTARCWRR